MDWKGSLLGLLKRLVLELLAWIHDVLTELWMGGGEEDDDGDTPPAEEPAKPELWDPRLDDFGVYVERKPRGKYYIHAVWMTENGNWDNVPSWAKAWQQDTLGGDHHVYYRAETHDGKPIDNTYVLDWPPYDDTNAGTTTTEGNGWGNLPMAGQNWDPATGVGPYMAWCFDGDRIYGLGLPHNHHVSFFVVWRPR